MSATVLVMMVVMVMVCVFELPLVMVLELRSVYRAGIDDDVGNYVSVCVGVSHTHKQQHKRYTQHK